MRGCLADSFWAEQDAHIAAAIYYNRVFTVIDEDLSMSDAELDAYFALWGALSQEEIERISRRPTEMVLQQGFLPWNWYPATPR